MSRVDDELTKALEESETIAKAEPAYGVSVESASPKRKGNRGLLAALLVMVIGILSLVFLSFKNAAVYAYQVDQAVKEQTKLTGRNIKVQGILTRGTLVRRDQPCEYRFTVESKGVKLPVRLPACVVPDTFRDVPGMDTEVTATGTLTAAGHFEATHVMAKCPSKYEMRDRAEKGERAPHLQMQTTTAL
jgi:cytochrome c-type biogenesis protein CcmE